MPHAATAPGPVTSGLDADGRRTAWVIAGRPGHEFTGGKRDRLCRVCAGPRSGADHPPHGRYSKPRESVLVPGPLTEPQFRHIGTLLGTSLGRHKDGAGSYAFAPRSTQTAGAVCAFLRGQNIPHDRETTRRWAP
jgi:hypothetical protein